MADETTQRTLLSDGPQRPAPRTACLVVIHGEALGRRIDIGDAPVLVGRSQDADLSIAHRSVSREHCVVWREGDEYRIRDLGATNPVRVGDDRLDASATGRVLVDGDHVSIGESILKFISRTSVEASYHEEIYQLATHDPLSELCNRRHFCELADKEIARAFRHGRGLALCIIDVDLFKPINDRHGHIEGDAVLRRLAAVLRGEVRDDDIAGRIGGEEFAVLLCESDAHAAAAFGERLRQVVADTPFEIGGERRQVTISVGIATLSPARASRSLLMAAADAALYRAKREGRNLVRISE